MTCDLLNDLDLERELDQTEWHGKGKIGPRSDAMLIIWHVLFKSTQVNIWYMLVYGCRETYRVMFNEVRGYCSFCWCWWKCFFFHKSQKLYIIDKAVASRKVISFYGPRRLSLQTRKASFSIFYGIKMKRTFHAWKLIAFNFTQLSKQNI